MLGTNCPKESSSDLVWLVFIFLDNKSISNSEDASEFSECILERGAGVSEGSLESQSDSLESSVIVSDVQFCEPLLWEFSSVELTWFSSCFLLFSSAFKFSSLSFDWFSFFSDSSELLSLLGSFIVIASIYFVP